MEEIRCDYEVPFGGYSWCTLSDNPCFKETGECDEYNEHLEEEKNEREDIIIW